MSDFIIEVGRVYRNWADEFVKIVEALQESHIKFVDGFRFMGSNSEFYRPSGTSSDGCDLHEDVTILVSGTHGEEGRVCKTQEEASSLGLQGPKSPHGWIQWKGTAVCMDIYCRCGYHSHIDAEFAYYVECPACHRTYVCSGNIELIEYTQSAIRNSMQPKTEDGPIDIDNFSGNVVENDSFKRIK